MNVMSQMMSLFPTLALGAFIVLGNVTVPVHNSGTLWTDERDAVEWKQNFRTVTQSTDIAFTATRLAICFDMLSEAGVNLREFRQQDIVSEVDEVLQRIHVRVVDKMLTAAQLNEKFAVQSLGTFDEILLHYNDLLAQFLDLFEFLEVAEQHGVDVLNP